MPNLNWNKIAEAFGRAVTHAGDKPITKMINETGRKSDGWYAYMTGKGDSYGPQVSDKEFDAFLSRRAKQGLQRHFDDAIVDAAIRRRDLTGLPYETAREQIIDELMQSKDILDVLGR